MYRRPISISRRCFGLFRVWGKRRNSLARTISARSKLAETRALVHQDATIIESHKREAQGTYEGTRYALR